MRVDVGKAGRSRVHARRKSGLGGVLTLVSVMSLMAGCEPDDRLSDADTISQLIAVSDPTSGMLYEVSFNDGARIEFWGERDAAGNPVAVTSIHLADSINGEGSEFQLDESGGVREVQDEQGNVLSLVSANSESVGFNFHHAASGFSFGYKHETKSIVGPLPSEVAPAINHSSGFTSSAASTGLRKIVTRCGASVPSGSAVRVLYRFIDPDGEPTPWQRAVRGRGPGVFLYRLPRDYQRVNNAAIDACESGRWFRRFLLNANAVLEDEIHGALCNEVLTGTLRRSRALGVYAEAIAAALCDADARRREVRRRLDLIVDQIEECGIGVQELLEDPDLQLTLEMQAKYMSKTALGQVQVDLLPGNVTNEFELPREWALAELRGSATVRNGRAYDLSVDVATGCGVKAHFVLLVSPLDEGAGGGGADERNVDEGEVGRLWARSLEACREYTAEVSAGPDIPGVKREVIGRFPVNTTVDNGALQNSLQLEFFPDKGASSNGISIRGVLEVDAILREAGSPSEIKLVREGSGDGWRWINTSGHKTNLTGLQSTCDVIRVVLPGQQFVQWRLSEVSRACDVLVKGQLVLILSKLDSDGRYRLLAEFTPDCTGLSTCGDDERSCCDKLKACQELAGRGRVFEVDLPSDAIDVRLD